MTVTIYHNPRCSKSRETLKLIRERGLEPRIIDYLGQPPTATELKRITVMLGITARELLRSGEAACRQLGLNEPKTDDELIAAMAAHPGLIQRPIVIHGEQARLGRPPEAVLEILP